MIQRPPKKVTWNRKILALTEDDFLAIQKKMDKTDQRLDDLYKNWHAEYRDAVTLEECDEIKKFYKPYLEKY